MVVITTEVKWRKKSEEWLAGIQFVKGSLMICLVVVSVTTDVATPCGQRGPLLYQANSSWFSEWVGLAQVIWLGPASTISWLGWWRASQSQHSWQPGSMLKNQTCTDDSFARHRFSALWDLKITVDPNPIPKILWERGTESVPGDCFQRQFSEVPKLELLWV